MGANRNLLIAHISAPLSRLDGSATPVPVILTQG
jgi:hypothetical protein